MHSIAMPSLPASLTIFSSIATSPTPCCAFLPLTPLQSPLKQTRYRDATSLDVPSLLVSGSPITSQPFVAQGLSRASMSPIRLSPLTAAAMRTLNGPNVSSSSPDLTLVALNNMRAAFLSARLPRRFSQANALRLSLSSRCFLPRLLPSFFRRVGCSTPNTHLLLHRQTLFLLACALRASPSPDLGSHIVRDGGVPTWHGCRGKRCRLVGLHDHQLMLLAGLHCQHRRVLASIDVKKGHQFIRELYSQHAK